MVQDTPRYPMIVQAIPGIVCKTKTMALYFSLFLLSYVDMDSELWND